MGIVLCASLSVKLGADAYVKSTPPKELSIINTKQVMPAPSPPAKPNIPPQPTAAMGYYVNSSQSFYANVRAMKDSGRYPSLDAELANLLQEPIATWLGEWLGGTDQVMATVQDITTKAAAANQMPVLVSYNIPDRDLGQFSAGGAPTTAAYQAWIAAISQGVADRPAVIILEPDALPGVPDMPRQQAEERLAMLHQALQFFGAHNPNAYVYVDAGNSKWLSTSDLVKLLKSVYEGTNQQPRISLNVSNARPVPELAEYFKQVNALYGGNLKALFDIGLSGAPTPPPVDDWCNPRGARHGTLDDAVFNPTSSTEQLMVRPIGESSGECDKGDPEAGQFDADLAATILGLPSGRYAE